MYENIIKAMSRGPLSIEERGQNYRIFDELMKGGVSLGDVLKRAEKPKEDGLSREVFTRMEEAVRECPSVVIARESADAVRTEILNEMLLKDDRYRKALEDYRSAVSEAYVRQKENKALGDNED